MQAGITMLPHSYFLLVFYLFFTPTEYSWLSTQVGSDPSQHRVKEKDTTMAANQSSIQQQQQSQSQSQSQSISLQYSLLSLQGVLVCPAKIRV